MWKNEKLFGKAVMQKIKAESGICFRLETASTAPGIPDLYAMASGIDYFLEFKNMPSKFIKSNTFKIAWRAGQQRFALQYREKMHCFKEIYYDDADDIYIEGFEQKYTWTFVGCKDGVLAVPMYQVFENNIVHSDDAVFAFTMEEFKKLNILEFLRAHSQVFMPADSHSAPEQRICAMQEFWLKKMLLNPVTFDYAAASDIIAENPALFSSEHCSDETLLKQYYFVADSMLEQYHSYRMNM